VACSAADDDGRGPPAKPARRAGACLEEAAAGVQGAEQQGPEQQRPVQRRPMQRGPERQGPGAGGGPEQIQLWFHSFEQKSWPKNSLFPNIVCSCCMAKIRI
jgi:hypothetical protein